MNIIFGIAIGVLLSLVVRILNDRGHSVFGVKDLLVQQVVCKLIPRFTTVWRQNVIHAGPTHQQVLVGGTVVSYFDADLQSGLPYNVRSFVVWGKKRRKDATRKLVNDLRSKGYAAEVHEPLKEFPEGTFFLVTSSGFVDCGIAFRPHWIKMAYLDARIPRK